MSADLRRQREAATAESDEKLLAELGYRQEFQRAFRPLEVLRPPSHIQPFRTTYLILGFWNSIQHCRTRALYRVCPYSALRLSYYRLFTYSSVMFYSIPNGGPVAMVWGVSFIFFGGLSMAELASAAPTSGGVRNVLHSAPTYDIELTILCGTRSSSIFGPTHIPPPSGATPWLGLSAVCRPSVLWILHPTSSLTDANTIGMISSVASVDWGAAVQIMAAAGLSSNGSFTMTNSKTLFVFMFETPFSVSV